MKEYKKALIIVSATVAMKLLDVSCINPPPSEPPVKSAEPAIVQPVEPPDPIVSAETPYEALLLALSGINKELVEARKAFHNPNNSTFDSRLFEEEIKRLEEDRKVILRILGEQAARERKESQAIQSGNSPSNDHQ